MNERLLIVGGDAAGLSAAALVARLGAQKEICVFERGGAASYAACGMPYFLKGAIPDPASLLMRGIEEFHAAGVEVRLEHEVKEIDTATQRATVIDKRTGAQTTERFDQLLLATGARASLPSITNIQASNVFTLRHYDDAIAIDAYCQGRRPR
ncbi:MAG: FAD-dependent oxidoreductase, partial [Solirubrobacteraceae bacterium]